MRCIIDCFVSILIFRVASLLANRVNLLFYYFYIVYHLLHRWLCNKSRWHLNVWDCFSYSKQQQKKFSLMSKNLRIHFYLLSEFSFILNKFVINSSIEIVVLILVVHRLLLIDNKSFSKNNFSKLITITIFNEKIVIFAY